MDGSLITDVSISRPPPFLSEIARHLVASKGLPLQVPDKDGDGPPSPLSTSRDCAVSKDAVPSGCHQDRPPAAPGVTGRLLRAVETVGD